MDVKTFQDSLKSPAPPAGLSAPVVALWHAARHDFGKAADAIKDDASRDANWVRACLHRAQGNDAEADIWYRRAGKSKGFGSVDDEMSIVAAGLLLGPGGGH